MKRAMSRKLSFFLAVCWVVVLIMNFVFAAEPLAQGNKPEDEVAVKLYELELLWAPYKDQIDQMNKRCGHLRQNTPEYFQNKHWCDHEWKRLGEMKDMFTDVKMGLKNKDPRADSALEVLRLLRIMEDNIKKKQ